MNYLVFSFSLRTAKQRSKVEQCYPYRCKHRLRICSAQASRDWRDFLPSRVKTFTLVTLVPLSKKILIVPHQFFSLISALLWHFREALLLLLIYRRITFSESSREENDIEILVNHRTGYRKHPIIRIVKDVSRTRRLIARILCTLETRAR